jgi:hypothetical protein
MTLDDVQQELDDREFIGVVEDIDDPKRAGRIRVRVERLHGRKGDTKMIPTQHLPWVSPVLDLCGGSYASPGIGKVVNVKFIQGDWYRGVYDSSIHYNYNLQEHLQTLDLESYKEFYSVCYDDNHQYYHDKDKGVVFDYVKSLLNIKPNGDIVLGLRDNKSKLYLGSEDASQSAMLGDHFMEMFDELIINMMGVKGGPYLGNLGAPLIPNPSFLEFCNKYFTDRPKFLSDHVMIVDDQRVKPNNRGFDKKVYHDMYNDETLGKVTDDAPTGYTPVERTPGAEMPSAVPSNTFLQNLSSVKTPPSPKPIELKKLANPYSAAEKGGAVLGAAVQNGAIPGNLLAVSKHLKKSFPEGDERQLLMAGAAESLDEFLDAYHAAKDSSMPGVTVMKGYQGVTRQNTIRKQYSSAPNVGSDPFGWANQIELYWGVNRKDTNLVNDLKDFIGTGQASKSVSVYESTLAWLIQNGPRFGWTLAGRDGNGEQQWWHWIYTKTP